MLSKINIPKTIREKFHRSLKYGFSFNKYPIIEAGSKNKTPINNVEGKKNIPIRIGLKCFVNDFEMLVNDFEMLYL